MAVETVQDYMARKGLIHPDCAKCKYCASTTVCLKYNELMSKNYMPCKNKGGLNNGN